MKNLTAEQKAKAQARREAFRKLVKQVSEMDDGQRAQLTNQVGAVVTCEGRALSLTNTMLLLLQAPGVSMVGGFRQWIKTGRAVRKGEHGHMIWFPKTRSVNADLGHGNTGPANVEPSAGELEKSETRFLIGTVFDISQTSEIETSVNS